MEPKELRAEDRYITGRQSVALITLKLSGLTQSHKERDQKVKGRQ